VGQCMKYDAPSLRAFTICPNQASLCLLCFRSWSSCLAYHSSKSGTLLLEGGPLKCIPVIGIISSIVFFFLGKNRFRLSWTHLGRGNGLPNLDLSHNVSTTLLSLDDNTCSEGSSS